MPKYPIEPEKFEKIVRSMTNITPNEDQLRRITLVRATYQGLVATILESTPASREQSLAITNLEDSLMWATKSIVLET